MAHRVLGNTPFTHIGILPIFPIPNIMINPFLLEGNAVLNESRFGNGGRLYRRICPWQRFIGIGQLVV